MSYAPIYFRSYFSLLRGLYSPEKICQYARDNGYPAIGMVDINNFYGLVRFIKAARFYGVKPLAGVSVRKQGKELFIAYIKNKQGFIRLSGLISQLLYDESPYLRNLAGESYDPVADLAEKGWEGLTIVSEDSEVLTTLKKKTDNSLLVKLVYGKPFRQKVLWAKEAGLSLLCMNEAVSIDKNDTEVFNLLRAIDLNTTIYKIDSSEKLEPWNTIAGPVEMNRFFSAVPEALAAGEELIKESSLEEVLSGSAVFPSFEGKSEEESFELLKSICFKGIDNRYGPDAEREKIEARLTCELAIVKEKNFAGYFLVVKDIVSQCPNTCGRGSAASSIISYLLGITHVDPLKYNLYFERFLNKGRKDPPDIDVDFPWDERDKVLAYVFKKYGNKTAMVANHVTFGGRSCLRETAKALSIKKDEIETLIEAWNLKQYDKIPEYVTKTASRIKGFPHYMGLHCGGVVITPQPITHYTHIQMSLAGYPVMAWEKDSTEEAGLVKIDLLGNRSLGVLRDSLKLIDTRHQKKIDNKKFNPIKDEKTKNLIESGNTTGIFYIESPATRQLLKKMRKGDYENIVITTSIIRPAANHYIKLFVQRLHGESYRPIHPFVAETLKETFGILVYQEDVSRVAVDLAGLTVEEADSLRKVISKKDRIHVIEDYRELFFKKGKARGVSEDVLEIAWNIILSFQGYSFCKAHSASYALVAYKLAFCKAHYPGEFMISVINNGGGYYSRQTYLNEIKRMGIKLLKPDINKSDYLYSMEGKSIRVGLEQIKGISRALITLLLTERKKQPFKNLHDFFKRVKPPASDIRGLIRSGTLDSIAGKLTRPQIFWSYFTSNQDETLFDSPIAPGFVGDYSEQVKLHDEIQTMGVLISQHPLKILKKRVSALLQKNGISRIISSGKIEKYVNKRVCMAGMVVTGKEVITQKKQRMIFVSFEDPDAIYETVFFPDAFDRFYPLLAVGGVYLIMGKVEEDQGAVNLNVERLIRVSRN